MMFHFMRSDHDTDQRRSLRSWMLLLFTALLAAGLAVAIMIGNPVSSDLDRIMVVSLLIIAAGIIPVSLLFSNPPTTTTAEKQKRVSANTDMYSLIDRMVEELDEDEIAYLQQRLSSRLYADKQDLQNSLGELLNQRAENRLRE